MCDICKGFKDYEHSLKIHKANKEKESLYQSQFPAVNEYEKKFKHDLTILAGNIMDQVVREAFKIVKEKEKNVKKALVMDVNELDRLSKIINKNILEFVAKEIGPNTLTDDQKKFLLKSGINPNILTKEQLTVFDIAFKHGMFASSAGRDEAKKMNLHNFEQFLKSNKFLSLDKKEQAALNSVKMEAGKYITGLGNRWNDQVQAILIEADKKQRANLEEAIYDESKQAIANRKTVQQFASDLGHATGLWSRDIIRNSQYILHDAHEHGAVQEAERVYGEDVKVYKYVYPGACKHCVRLFLTKGEGSKPKIFSLDELRANGSNIGVKVADWKATVGPVHPYCRCELVVLQDFQTWDDKKGKFINKMESAKDIREEIRLKMLERNGKKAA